MRGRNTLLVVPTAALLMSACQTADLVQTDIDSITGVYELMKIDDVMIPGKVDHDGFPLVVSSGNFTINADGTCRSSTVFMPPDGETVAREVRARYELDGAELTMTWEAAGITRGTVVGDTFVMDNHGMIFEYERRWD